jgi:hypothetical protein
MPDATNRRRADRDYPVCICCIKKAIRGGERSPWHGPRLLATGERGTSQELTGRRRETADPRVRAQLEGFAKGGGRKAHDLFAAVVRYGGEGDRRFWPRHRSQSSRAVKDRGAGHPASIRNPDSTRDRRQNRAADAEPDRLVGHNMTRGGVEFVDNCADGAGCAASSSRTT